MAKIARKTALIFGSNSGFEQIAQFGSLAASSPNFSIDPAVIQALAQWVDGWFDAVLGNNSPAIEDMNAYCYVIAYQIAYSFQAGIAEWDTDTIYFIGSMVQIAGVVYMSLTDTNTGNTPVGDHVNWRIVGGGIMTALGDIIYGGTNGDATRLAAGSNGSRLWLKAGAPVWADLPMWSGYTDPNASWLTTSSSFNDGTNSGGNALTTRITYGGLAPTAGGSNVAGYTFTPASITAIYELAAVFNGSNNSNKTANFSLTDGTNIIQQTSFGTPSGGSLGSAFSGALYQPGVITPVTVKIQISSTGGGTTTIEASANPSSVVPVIEWSLKQLTL